VSDENEFAPINTLVHVSYVGVIPSCNICSTLHATSIFSITKATLGNLFNELAIAIPMQLGHKDKCKQGSRTDWT
jgi:hypothetical protein